MFAMIIVPVTILCIVGLFFLALYVVAIFKFSRETIKNDMKKYDDMKLQKNFQKVE